MFIRVHRHLQRFDQSKKFSTWIYTIASNLAKNEHFLNQVFAAGGDIWEIPAGVLEPGESPAECAHRELQEETGGTTSNLQLLTTILTTPGFTDERIHLFVATDVELGRPSHQPDESIELVPTRLSRVLSMIKEGEIQDSKSISALLYVSRFVIQP